MYVLYRTLRRNLAQILMDSSKSVDLNVLVLGYRFEQYIGIIDFSIHRRRSDMI